MIELSDISSDTLEWYSKKLKNKIDTSSLSGASKIFLEEDIIEALLTKKPDILLDIHTSSPCELKDKAVVEEIFNYKKYISGVKNFSYELSRKIGINTCAYCNRNYTLTIINKDNETGRENDSTRIVRPHFDHWFSQADYPLLALSIYNLIPSCYICNSSIKSSKPLNLNEHLHPYIKEENTINKDFIFSYDLDELPRLEVKVICAKDSKIQKTLDFFKIQEVYNAHANFELKNLYDLRYKYSDTFLEIVENNFGGIMKKQEAYELIFGIEFENQNYHKRPFSKFKNDIIKELLKR